MNKRKRLSNYHNQIVELAKTNTARSICKTLELARNSLADYLIKNNIKCIVDRKSMIDYKDQIKVLANNGLTPTEIANELGLDTNSVRYNLKVNNIPFADGRALIRKNKLITDKIINLIKNGASYNEVSSELKVSPSTIANILDLNGIKKLTSQESYRKRNPLNENAFLDFNDELAVYWYGWLLTDGCLSDNNSIALGLQGRDVSVVQGYADYVGAGAEVKVKTYFHKQSQKNIYSASFSVRNKVLADRLREQGMEPRKSCKERLPLFDWLNGENSSIFWRACIEGDGHITKDLQHCSISLVGSEELLLGFKKYAEIICGTKLDKNLVCRKYGDPNFRQITYCGLDARKIMRKLWSKGTVFLERKRKVVEMQLNYHLIKDSKT